jgi:predicted butyrate kinase (DUF1464 family)
VLSVGIDYQAGVWRLALWDEDREAILQSFSDLARLLGCLDDVCASSPAVPIVLPSGFGIPLTRARDLLDRDIGEMTLASNDDDTGLASLLAEARPRYPRAFCIPSVKLLPSIPLHRKRNRLDLGGADALCAAVWGLYSLRRAGRSPAALSFLLGAIDRTGRTLIVVREGRVVDGLGRTAAGLVEATPTRWRELLERRGLGLRRARDPERPEADGRGDAVAFWEGVAKEIHALLHYYGLPELILSGERRAEAAAALGDGLASLPAVAPTDGYEAALGAAVLAGGLTGGPTAWIVDALGLREARERVCDWLAT